MEFFLKKTLDILIYSPNDAWRRVWACFDGWHIKVHMDVDIVDGIRWVKGGWQRK